jgi:cell division protein ZapA
MKQIEVSILGQVYMLGCPEGGEVSLRNAVATVDREMTVIRDSGKVKARERIAVLAALNLAYQIAERGDAPTASGTAATAATTAAAQAQATDDPADPAHNEALGALLQRIDAALAEDGQLL